MTCDINKYAGFKSLNLVAKSLGIRFYNGNGNYSSHSRINAKALLAFIVSEAPRGITETAIMPFKIIVTVTATGCHVQITAWRARVRIHHGQCEGSFKRDLLRASIYTSIYTYGG